MIVYMFYDLVHVKHTKLLPGWNTRKWHILYLVSTSSALGRAVSYHRFLTANRATSLHLSSGRLHKIGCWNPANMTASSLFDSLALSILSKAVKVVWNWTTRMSRCAKVEFNTTLFMVDSLQWSNDCTDSFPVNWFWNLALINAGTHPRALQVISL